MSVRVMTLVWSIDLPDSEKIVLLALADCANDEGHCWPGMASLSRKCSKSERTIQGAIKSLCDKGHLTRREVPGKGCNYTVHPRSACAPAAPAPPQGLPPTPAAAAGKPSRTVNSKKDKPSSRARAKPKVPLPDDWGPKPIAPGTICDQIVSRWEPGRIERELSKFRDHHLRSDQRWSDWDAAWRTWIQRAPDFERQERNGQFGNDPAAAALNRLVAGSVGFGGGAGEVS